MEVCSILNHMRINNSLVVPAHKTEDSNRAVFEYNIRKSAYSVTVFVTSLMNIWIYPVCGEISSVYYSIYCMLMPVMSSIQMEITLGFDRILKTATRNLCLSAMFA